MDLISCDLETHWASDYSLSKMTPLGYVMDERFETISLAIKVNRYPTDVIFGEDNVAHALRSVRNTIGRGLMVAHNMSGFDAYVLAYRFGVAPKLWGCTLAMARPIHAKTCGLSLAALVKHYAKELEEMGISSVKDNAALINTKGKRLADFTPAEIEAMRAYNRDDTEQCFGLFHLLKRHHKASELWHIDSTIRMRTEPAFELDVPLLERTQVEERERKHTALVSLAQQLGLDELADDDLVATIKTELASAPRFSAILESRGVEVPMKSSPSDENKMIPALAKTDQAFLDLQEHEDAIVAAAARARLDVKSTLLETRIGKFLTAGSLAGGRLPVPLRYAGADTTGRDSGEEYNCFTGDVEVLTPTGWTRFDAWQGEPIMQWWPDGTATFELNPATLVKPHNGEIVDVDAVLFSAAMTPDHRVPVVRDGRVRDYTAADLARLKCLNGLVAAAHYKGGTSAVTPAEARLLVAIAADGCVVQRKAHFAIQIGLRRTRKIERLLHLLEQVDCTYYTRETPPRNTHTGDHNTVQFTLPESPYKKGFGPWILELSRPALDALVDELRYWDGWSHAKTGATEFSTSDLEQAQWVCTALHLSGKPATLRQYRTRFQMHARESVYTSVPSTSVGVKRYEGAVYCAGVESSYIFIRRNNKIAVAGQCQNLPRIMEGTPRPTDALRMSLRAPKGKMVIVADQSGIELRVNHFLWKVEGSMALYQASPDEADLYREFAGDLFNLPPEAIVKWQRQFGKVGQLGLGFGSGPPTFKRIAKTMGGLDIPVVSTDGTMDATTTVQKWRTKYHNIVTGWKTCGTALQAIYDGKEREVDPWGLVHTCKEGFVLPSGRIIRYPDLRQIEDGTWPDGRVKTSWVYAHGRHMARITGPKADENIVQALARDSVFDCSLEYFKRTGLRPALRVHDELVYVVDEGPAHDLLAELQAVMRTPPKWWPELVVWSEGDAAPSYGEAK